jgi:LCP family protein required for cell wall assembly
MIGHHTSPVPDPHDRERRRPAPQDAPPEYTRYRARPRLLGRDGDETSPLGALRGEPRGRRPRGPGRPLSWGRVVKWLVLAALGWVALAVVVFLVSATVHQQNVGAALDGGGVPPFGATNILVLGSDQRPSGSKEPGASTSGPSRSDSIILMRVGGGHNAKLSIPRDTVVDIPGHGQDKINAAFAIGGAALAIETVKQYLGVEVNHVVEIDFQNFPGLIDAMGGIDYKGGCVVSRINGGFKNGGYTLRLHSGSTHIDGKQALALARTRHNLCNPRESDLTRARRQQKIFAAMKSQVIGFAGFLRGPFIGWKAPTAIRSDMSGPTLLGMAAALATSGTAPTHVLRPSGGVTLPDGGAGLTVSDAEKRSEVQRFLDG